MRIIYILLIITIFGCKPEKKVESKVSALLPTIPIEDLKYLYDHCDAVDYIFRELPFSVSQNNQSSIRVNLTYIDTVAVTTDYSGCYHLGREFFQVNGEVIKEAELYFGDDCMYMIWMEGNKAVYGNKLSMAGQQFYGNLIAQAQKLQKNAQQQ